VAPFLARRAPGPRGPPHIYSDSAVVSAVYGSITSAIRPPVVVVVLGWWELKWELKWVCTS